MEEEEESASKKMRIYVGGLGAATTEDDLRKVFQSVGGVVEAVDFVRTKSRCFAYVDFFPSSQSSLSKLFSTVSFSPRFQCQTLISLFPSSLDWRATAFITFLFQECSCAYLRNWLRF